MMSAASPTTGPATTTRALPGMVYILLWLCYVATVAPEFGWDHEDTLSYLALAESLAGGSGYAISGIPHVKYPPGWPALMAPLFTLFGASFRLLHIYVITFGIAGLWLADRLMCRYLPPARVRLALILASTSYFFWSFSTVFLTSEMAYLFFSMAALSVSYELLEQNRWQPMHYLALGSLLVASYFTRSIGLALIVAVLLTLFIRGIQAHRVRRWGGAVLLAVLVAGALGGWSWRNARMPVAQGEPYLTYFSKHTLNAAGNDSSPVVGLASVVARNVHLHLKNVGLTVTSFPKRADALRLVAISVALLAVYGFWLQVKKRWTATELYLICYSGILLVWPYWEETTRFWLPLIPFVFYHFLAGAEAALSQLAVRTRAWSPAHWKRVAVVLTLVWGSATLFWVWPTSDEAPRLFVLAEWLLWSGIGALALLWVATRTSDRRLWLEPRLWRFTVAGVVLVLALHNGVFAAYRTRLKYDYHAYREAGVYGLFEAGQWLRTHAAPDAIVWTPEALFVHITSGQRCEPLPRLPPSMLSASATVPVYVVVPRGGEHNTDPSVLARLAQSGRLQYKGTDVSVYLYDQQHYLVQE